MVPFGAAALTTRTLTAFISDIVLFFSFQRKTVNVNKNAYFLVDFFLVENVDF